jgi:enoyl-CoA hydratase/carnithine racemase
MDYQDILYSKEEGIATITLNRPDQLNAFSVEMLSSLFAAMEDAANDNDVRVLVFTGTGRAFCSGADVKGMAEGYTPGYRGPEESGMESGDYPLYPRVHRFEKPTIAAINGLAVGGGFDFALNCDIRIASNQARFAEVFIRRGLIPVGGGTYLLPRLIGIDKACQLIWTGDMIDAQEAERIGLVTMVVPHDELANAARELAEKLAKGPPLAIREAKRAIYEGLKMDLTWSMNYTAAIAQQLKTTEDHKEGARAFIEKRQPVFKGR